MRYEESTGNVFADLGFKYADEMLAKCELSLKINKMLKRKKLTKNQAYMQMPVELLEQILKCVEEME
jgi:predicted XRE-type DNA-binding protein